MNEQLSLPPDPATPRTRRRPRVDAVVVLLAAAALAFLLPFGAVSCNEETVRFTGIELATRHVEPDPVSALAPDKGLAGEVEAEASVGALWALVFCVFGIGSAVLLGRGGGFALAAMLSLLLLLLDAGINNGEVGTDVDTALGFWLALAAATGAVAFRWHERQDAKEDRVAAGLPKPQRAWRERAPSIALGVAALALATAVDEVNTRDPAGGAGPSKVDFGESDSAPAWSPDGRWVAFTSNRDDDGIYRIRADGSCLTRVADGDEAVWSPDGGSLAVLQDAEGDDSRLVIVGMSGEQARIVAEGPFTHPQWSRDGTRVYVERAAGEDTTAAFAVSIETGALTRLAPAWVNPTDRRWSTVTVSEVHPSVSPNGARYVFQSSDDPAMGTDDWGERLFVREVGKPGRVRLTDPVMAGDHEPAWSPDGRRIAFQRSGEIAVVDVDDHDVRVLTSMGGATQPAWSPDGRSIVFSRELSGTGGFFGGHAAALQVVEAATGEVRKLTWGPGIPACA